MCSSWDSIWHRKKNPQYVRYLHDRGKLVQTDIVTHPQLHSNCWTKICWLSLKSFFLWVLGFYHNWNIHSCFFFEFIFCHHLFSPLLQGLPLYNISALILVLISVPFLSLWGDSLHYLCLEVHPCFSHCLTCSLLTHCTLPSSLQPYLHPSGFSRACLYFPCLLEPTKCISHNWFDVFDYYCLICDSSGFASVDWVVSFVVCYPPLPCIDVAKLSMFHHWVLSRLHSFNCFLTLGRPAVKLLGAIWVVEAYFQDCGACPEQPLT